MIHFKTHSGRELGGDVAEVWPHGALVGQVGAERTFPADRVAAGAAVLDDPLVASLKLLGLRNIGDLVMALQAARLDEPLGQHRIIPVVDLLPAVLLFPSSPSLRVSGRVRGVSEIGAGALAAVADRAAEAVDRVRAVGVEVKPRRDRLPLGDRGGRAVVRRDGRRRPGHLLRRRPFVAQPVDPLVAGGAAIVARHVLEVVIDRQFGKADLLDLGGRGGHVEAGKAAQEGQRLADTSERPPWARPSGRSSA